MVSSNDKKMPNGILEEQGMIHGVSALTRKGTGLTALSSCHLSLSLPPAPPQFVLPLPSSVEFLYILELGVRGHFPCTEERMSETFQFVVCFFFFFLKRPFISCQVSRALPPNISH